MESSIVTYLIHWFFIEIANRYFVYEYKLSLMVGLLVIVVFTLTGITFLSFCKILILGCVLTYLILTKVPYLGLAFGID